MADADEGFVPGPKSVYRYHNGKAMVFADPLLIDGCLTTKAIAGGKDIGALIALNNKPLKGLTGPEVIEVYQAQATLAGIARESFDLEPFDKATGEGADMNHALAVLSHFYAWCEKKNPPTDDTSISSPSATSIPSQPQNSISGASSTTTA